MIGISSCPNCGDFPENKRAILYHGMTFCGIMCVEHYCKSHTGFHCSTCGTEFCHVPDDCIKDIDGNKFCSPSCAKVYIKERDGLNMLDAKIQGDFN